MNDNQDEHNQLENNQEVHVDEAGKQNGKKLLLSFILLLVLVGSAFIYTKQVSKESAIQKPIHIVHDYTPLIDNWNRQVQNITNDKKFLLNRDSNEEMIEQLNEFMKTFYIADISDSVQYNTYLEENKIDKLISFDTSMDADKIKQRLKNATHKNAISDIVKKVLFMNDIELWLNNKKTSESLKE